MGKLVMDVVITTVERNTSTVRAVWDSGSFYTIIREDRLPPGSGIQRYPSPEILRGAAKGSRLEMIGVTELIFTVGEKMIRDSALVSPDLAQDLLIGAKTMQAWDISIVNSNGHTTISIGHDMRDPDIIEVD